MGGDGKEKWLMVWMRVMMNLNHDPLFYAVFQGAINYVCIPFVLFRLSISLSYLFFLSFLLFNAFFYVANFCLHSTLNRR